MKWLEHFLPGAGGDLRRKRILVLCLAVGIALLACAITGLVLYMLYTPHGI